MWRHSAVTRAGALPNKRRTSRARVFPEAYYGPTLKLFESVGESGAAPLAADLADLARRYDQNGDAGGPIAIRAEYLESVMIKA